VVDTISYEAAVEVARAYLRDKAALPPGYSDSLCTYIEMHEHLAAHGYRVHYRSRQMNNLLNRVSALEDGESRGLLSALVVRKKDGKPGRDFAQLARDMYGRRGSDDDIWFAEVERIRLEAHG